MYQVIADEPDFLVISKDVDVHFHSQDGTPGVVARVKKDYKRDIFPVHRLDTITSGLIILGKSSQAARELSLKFAQQKIDKYYIALAHGKPKKKQGAIIGDMAKSRRGGYKLLHSRINPAITHFFSYSVKPGLRLYLLRPSGGKTHQLRVAMKSLGVPILGDKLYGGAEADRGYLHAWYLEFEYQGKRYNYCSDHLTGKYFQLEGTMALLHQVSPPNQLKWAKKKKNNKY